MLFFYILILLLMLASGFALRHRIGAVTWKPFNLVLIGIICWLGAFLAFALAWNEIISIFFGSAYYILLPTGLVAILAGLIWAAASTKHRGKNVILTLLGIAIFVGLLGRPILQAIGLSN